MRIQKYQYRYIIIVICALIRCGLYGFSFSPVLDDWVQYGTFSLEMHPYRDIFLGLGYWTFRPMSWILDISVWCHIPFLLPIIITLMHAFACVILLRIAKKINFHLGVPFIIIFMFFPVNTEATMWMSASTRIIVPVFLSCLALNFGMSADSKSKKKNIIYLSLFVLFQLISFFIYEQVAVCAFIIAIFVGICSKRKSIIIITSINALLLVAYYAVFLPMGPAMDRAVPVNGQLWSFWMQFSTVMGNVIWGIISNGFVRGTRVLFQHWLYFILVVIGSFAFALYSFKEFSILKGDAPKKTIIWKIIVGAAIFVSSLVPFMIIKGNSLALRNFFIPFIGLALIFDGIFDLIPRKNSFMPALSGVLVFIFIVCGISELTDYRATSLADRAYALGIAPQAMQQYFYVERIPSLLQTQNAVYAEHILSVTSSDWALTGAVRYLTENLQIPTIKVVWDSSQMPDASPTPEP